jgi:hypothetical protein
MIVMFAALLLGPLPSAMAAPDSAVDQYTEGQPDATGERPSTGGGSGGGSSGPLDADTVEQFEERSEDAAAAAALAQATAPKSHNLRKAAQAQRAKRDKRPGGGKEPAKATVPATLESETVEAGLSRSVGRDGLDLGLPLLLGVSLLGAIGYALARRRYGGLTPPRSSH